MNPLSATLKLWLLALLVFLGLSLIALAFVPGSPSSGFPPPSRFIMWGIACLLIAAVWIWWDRKRRRLTPDQEIEQLLFDVAKRYRQTRSLDTVVEEYRAKGATDHTLMIIRSAPRMLKQRADAKIQLGVSLLGTGLLFTAATYWLAHTVGFSHYEVAIGAIGGGVGFTLDGIRQRRAFRDHDTSNAQNFT
jgi:hypothetical protein